MQKFYRVTVGDLIDRTESTAEFAIKSNAALHALCMESADTIVTRHVAVVEGGKIIGWREVSQFR